MKKILLAALILMFSGILYADEKMRIAILDLQPKDTTKVIAIAVTDMLRADFVEAKAFTIVERGQMNAILKEQELQLTGCTDNNCAVEVGKLLSANKILIGEVTKISEDYIITVRIVDVGSGSVDYAARDIARGDSELAAAAKRTADKLAVEIRGEGLKFCISVRGGYLMPFGDFGKNLNPGYGGSAVLYTDNLLIVNLKAGVEVGYFLMEGKEDKVDSANIVPLQFYTGYSIYFGNFAMEPKVLAGFSYVTVKNTEDYASGKEASEFEPSAQAGLILSYKITERISLQAGADYGMIFEEKRQLNYSVFYGGLDVKF